MGSPLSAGPSNLRSNAGEVAVFYGGPAHRTDTDLAGSPPDSFVVFGVDAGDTLGMSVAAGDLNGDGFDDLILGSSGSLGEGNAGGGFTGEVTVLFGQATRFTADIDLQTGPSGVVTIYAASSGDFLGKAVAAGDLNGDGFDDLLLGVPSGDGSTGTRASSGEVVIVYGHPALTSAFIISLASPPLNVSTVYGTNASDSFGSSVASGDVDGDGFDDLLVGALGVSVAGSGGSSDTGGGAIVYGGPGQLPNIDLAAPPASAATLIFGVDAGDGYGTWIAAGDLDGDGFDETILGSEGADGPGNGRNTAGEAAILYGGPARPSSLHLASAPPEVAFVFGSAPFVRTGAYLATGDLDGDGFDELLLGGTGNGPAGTRSNVGEVAVLFGFAGRHSDVDLASAPPQVQFVFGRDTDDDRARVTAGDFDGDGLDDLALGLQFADGPGNSRSSGGEVAVIPGAPRSRYRHDAAPFAFIDATIGSDLGLGCDDCSATIPIGFEFDYFGRKYDTVTVASNGYLTFGGNGDLPLPFCPPNSATPNNAVAVLWDDWNPSASGAVYSLLEGTAPNRRLTIEWAGVPLFPTIGAATFEVTLFEISDQILMQYQDTLVGDVFSDNGATAVSGLENAVGVGGVPASCFSATVMDSSARRYRRFAAPTTFYYTDVEPVAPGWNSFSISGPNLWHNGVEPACSPIARSGTTSLYYGQDASCDYDTPPDPNSARAVSPIIPNLPQDASLRFWNRRQTEDFLNFDASFVEVQGDGGGFSVVAQVRDEQNAWVFSDDFLAADPLNGSFAPVDLSAYAGQDLEIQFRFETVDTANNGFFGWAVDNIEIQACPVFGVGGGAAAEARATAQPDMICETSAGSVDAIGSYCASCTAPLTYQWREEGGLIPGATGIDHAIPAGHATGIFDYTVEIACPTSAACADESDPAPVTVVQEPVEVGPTLMLGLDGTRTNLQFNWTDVAASSDYVVFLSTDPSVPFTAAAGSAVSGSSGLTVPAPPDPLNFFLVAGRNPVCGVGPQRAP